MKVIIVYNKNDADKLNELLMDYNILESNKISEYKSDDLGTFKKVGVIYTLEKKYI